MWRKYNETVQGKRFGKNWTEEQRCITCMICIISLLCYEEFHLNSYVRYLTLPSTLPSWKFIIGYEIV